MLFTERRKRTTTPLAELGTNFNLLQLVVFDAHSGNPIIRGKRRRFAADPEKAVRCASARALRLSAMHGPLSTFHEKLFIICFVGPRTIAAIEVSLQAFFSQIMCTGFDAV